MEFNGLTQDCGNSSALAMVLLQFCAKPSNYEYIEKRDFFTWWPSMLVKCAQISIHEYCHQYLLCGSVPVGHNVYIQSTCHAWLTPINSWKCMGAFWALRLLMPWSLVLKHQTISIQRHNVPLSAPMEMSMSYTCYWWYQSPHGGCWWPGTYTS